MKKAIYPGTFDPITLGHMDIIKRSLDIFDEVIVGVLLNSSKTPIFAPEERVEMIKKEVEGLGNVKVKSFDGLLVDFARTENVRAIIRGLRAVTDFEYELQMSQTNKVIAPEIDTIFMTASLKYAYLSSSIVREVASYGGDITKFVSEDVKRLTLDRIAAIKAAK